MGPLKVRTSVSVAAKNSKPLALYREKVGATSIVHARSASGALVSCRAAV